MGGREVQAGSRTCCLVTARPPTRRAARSRGCGASTSCRSSRGRTGGRDVRRAEEGRSARWIACTPTRSRCRSVRRARALARAELVQEAYVGTETARFADVLLQHHVGKRTVTNSERRASSRACAPPCPPQRADWGSPRLRGGASPRGCARCSATCSPSSTPRARSRNAARRRAAATWTSLADLRAARDPQSRSSGRSPRAMPRAPRGSMPTACSRRPRDARPSPRPTSPRPIVDARRSPSASPPGACATSGMR